MKIRFFKLISSSQRSGSKIPRIPRIFAFLLTLVLIFSIALPTPAMAEPQLPFQLYGDVTINGAPAPSDIPVTASIGGVVLFSSVTDASGRYGYDPAFFRVPADDPDTTTVDEGGVNGDTVQMAVSGIDAATAVFSSGAILNLNLTISAPINKLAFITPARTLDAGSISENITVQLQDPAGTPVIAGANTLVNLTSSSVAGRFDLMPGGPFDGSITSMTIPSGASTASFYYFDTQSGTPLVTALSAGITGAVQTQVVNPFTLAVIPIGSGSVTKNPDLPAYNYGDSVNLTATADYGWTFTGWSGNLTGSTNPAIVTIYGDTSINATFTRNEYILDTTWFGHGWVTRSPNQPMYHYGDNVTLTAFVDPGWAFSGWGGDLGGNNSPEYLIIDDNKSVTATFVPVPSKLAFITAPHTVDAHVPAGLITVQVQNQDGVPANISENTCIALLSNMAGAFDTSPIGPFDGTITSVIIPAGSNSAGFYYLSCKAGVHTLTVSAPNLTSAAQDVTVLPGAPYKLVFTTQPQTVNTNVSSGIMTVQVRDIYDNQVFVSCNMTVGLSSGSASGKFDITQTGPFNGSIVSVIIPAGAHSASFYYRDSTAGTYTISASSTGLTGCAQTIVVKAVPSGSAGAGGGGGGGGANEVKLKGLSTTCSLQLDYRNRTRYSCTLQTPDKDCTIIINKGTELLDKLGNPLAILTHSHDVELPEPPDGATVIGIHELGPDGATFEPGITLIFKIDTDKIQGVFDGDKIQVAYWDGSQWQFIVGQVDVDAGVVTVITTHFTIFVVLTESVPVLTPVPESTPVPTPEPDIPEPMPVSEPELTPPPEVIQDIPDGPSPTPDIPVIPDDTSAGSRSLLPIIFAAVVVILGIAAFSLFVIKRKNR